MHLVAMLNNLIVPAVRSQEAPIRERGLCCLGLCCLLGKNLAEENLTLFLHCFAKGHPALQMIALQIIADTLVTHPSLLALPSPDSAGADNGDLRKQVLKAFSKSLKSEDPAVQATGAAALSKLMLSQLVTDTDLLKQLVLAFFDPDTSTNAQLRQSLSYFLPVYCHSRAENAERLVAVSCGVLGKMATLRESFLEEAEVEGEDGQAEGAVVKLGVVGLMLVEWTDPRRIVGFAEAAAGGANAKGAEGLHFLLAEAVLDRLVTSQPGKEEKKVLFSMLGKLHLPAGGEGEAERLKSLLELLAEAVETKVAADATSRATLNKLQSALLKLFHDLGTDERGGGGGEETALETTEMLGETTVLPGAAADDEEVEEDEEEVTQLQQTLKDTTIGATTFGATTIGLPDAEGTRVQLGGGDTELLDSEMMDESL